MQATRPVHGLLIWLPFIFFLMVPVGISDGQELVLPDLFVEGSKQDDLVLPDDAPDPVGSWTAAPARSRRLYGRSEIPEPAGESLPDFVSEDGDEGGDSEGFGGDLGEL